LVSLGSSEQHVPHQSLSDTNTDTNNPDYAIYMIDASTPAQVLGEGEGAADIVSLVDFLREAKSLIVLINKM
jgi:translation elongation factor EF-1alpha